MASSRSHRRTVDADTASTSPAATACTASSVELHRDNGASRCAGGSHAIALTPATTSESNTRGRPDRIRSTSPTIPSSQNRFRQRDTTSTCTSSRSAMPRFANPPAANNTIFARTTSPCEAL
jgi:hypothetical protein